MADTQIIPGGVNAVPSDFTLAASQSFTIGALFAHFDGSAATSDFVPVVQIISDSGHTVLSVPVDSWVGSGGSADASWALGLSETPYVTKAIPYHLVGAATVNNTLVATGPRELTGYYLVNTAASFAYVKLFDKATAPAAGSDTPVAVYGIPASSAANVAFGVPVQFTNGLGFATTTGIADSDATAISSNQVSVTLYYR